DAVTTVTAMRKYAPYLPHQLHLLLLRHPRRKTCKVNIHSVFGRIGAAPRKHAAQVLVTVGQGSTKMTGNVNACGRKKQHSPVNRHMLVLLLPEYQEKQKNGTQCQEACSQPRPLVNRKCLPS